MTPNSSSGAAVVVEVVVVVIPFSEARNLGRGWAGHAEAGVPVGFLGGLA